MLGVRAEPQACAAPGGFSRSVLLRVDRNLSDKMPDFLCSRQLPLRLALLGQWRP
jgi:hypothetical protein